MTRVTSAYLGLMIAVVNLPFRSELLLGVTFGLLIPYLTTRLMDRFDP